MHHILDQALVQIFGLFVCLQSGIDLHFDHLRQLLRNLHLLPLKTVNIIPKPISSLDNLSSQIDFDLRSSELFLLDPPIDGSKLSFQALLQAHDGFVLSLELGFDDGVHGLVTVTHFVALAAGLLLINLILDIYLVFYLFNLPEPLLLLLQ